MLVATVEELLLLYFVNAEDEVVALLMLFVVLMLDLQLLLAIELALEARYLPLLVDVGDTPRFRRYLPTSRYGTVTQRHRCCRTASSFCDHECT
jgi:hypothetical protein